MSESRRNNAVAYALYVNAAVLVAILVAILSRGDSPSLLSAAVAQNQGPIAGGAGVFIMPAQLSVNTWGCYLLDIDAQTVVAYQYYPGDRQLRFVAARSYRYDRRLGNYNTTPPPAEIKDLVEKEQNANRVNGQNTTPTSPEAPRETEIADRGATGRFSSVPRASTRSCLMMAKMFYTIDEAKVALGKNEEEIKQLTREGRLREFRDGPRLMFKADQIEQLKGELGSSGPGHDQVDLGPSDTGAPIGLADSKGGSGTSITLTDSDHSGRSPGASGGGISMKDDTALAADLGLSGSLGGVPSPGRGVGSGGSGSGLSGTAGGSRGGVNVFSADDSVAHADPSAQTNIAPAVSEQVNLEGVGSGSGLLDLTRESDDTSLGAELLDEIAPGSTRRGPAESALGGTGVDMASIPAPRAGAPRGVTQPIFVEARDSTALAFGAAGLAAAIVSLFGIFVLTSAVVGTSPDIVATLADKGLWMVFGLGALAAIVLGIAGLFIGKAAR